VIEALEEIKSEKPLDPNKITSIVVIKESNFGYD
jgi:hypothetical protein